MIVNEEQNKICPKCPYCSADTVKTSDNDPLVMDRTKYKCTDCGNEHTVYEE